ncbi:transposase [Tabrizicola sp.]|uniref:transposase n=1 Tax=Tabrizicola sp. TaxID=2005166 RepID=UPI00386769BF
MSRPKAPTYRTTNWPEYNAALARRGSLLIWFDRETQWLAAPTGKRGRQPVFTDASIQACLRLKALFGLPLRQTKGIQRTCSARGLRPTALSVALSWATTSSSPGYFRLWTH